MPRLTLHAEHLSKQIHQLLLRCTTNTIASDAFWSKKQRKFAKYEHALLQCADDTKALERFVDAQVIAFRKILKKYRKWTGSAALGRRFKDVVLSHPGSFTKRSFFSLQRQYEEILTSLRAAQPNDTVARPPKFNERVDAQLSAASVSPPTQQAPEDRHEDQVVTSGYWNEYDDGSEAGDLQHSGGGYVIYVNSDDRSLFLGVDSWASAVAAPLGKMRQWLRTRALGSAGPGERQSLLPAQPPLYGSTTSTRTTRTTRTRSTQKASYFSSSPGADTSADSSDPDTESETAAVHQRRDSHGYASSDDFPAGYATHYATVLPSINEQRLTRHRERVFAWGTVGCYVASALFLSVAAILATAGRHRLRVEVDTGVTLGVMASLGCACVGLAMTFSRRDALGFFTRLTVWAVFALLCVCNGVMLLFLMGNSAT